VCGGREGGRRKGGGMTVVYTQTQQVTLPSYRIQLLKPLRLVVYRPLTVHISKREEKTGTITIARHGGKIQPGFKPGSSES